jgi:putative tryptophan/tyrosine transport system substrate-binding protein
MTPRCLRLFSLAVFLAVLGLTGSVAEAQRTRPVRIGALTESWGPTPQIVGMVDGLKELGYREEVDFTIGVRFTQGNPAELPAAARDLVRGGVDIIVAGEASNAAEAARTATDRIPIVFIGGSDPVGDGLVKSLARPGGNITGIADLDIELVPKRMEIFHEMVPGLKRVLFVYDATNAHATSILRVHRDAAHRLGLTLVERPVRSQEEAKAAIAGARRTHGDGLFSTRLLSLNIPGFILEAGARGTLPTMFHSAFFTERGGLASYAAAQRELGRGAASLVDKILKGAKPADLPVQQPTKFELVINLKTAKALGLTIPPSLLLRADRIIE